MVDMIDRTSRVLAGEGLSWPRLDGELSMA